MNRSRHPHEIPRVSPLLMRLFARYTRGYVGKHFHTLRVTREGMPAKHEGHPLVVYLNHPSWWDPLTCLMLATTLFPNRMHYAPIEAGGLSRYPILGRFGFFGIEAGTPRGAARFLRCGEQILSSPSAALWVTAAGKFVDPRERPVRLQPGVAHLARRLGDGVILPLAVEYPFWDQRTSEALTAFGEPIVIGRDTSMLLDELNTLLERRLEQTQDDLSKLSIKRDPAAFETLVGGRSGVGGVYDIWRRAKAALAGQHFSAEHGS